MKYAILAAQTGNGHISVMKTLANELLRRKVKVECFPDFYESIFYSNKVLSDFYNFLLANSIKLCNKYCELTNISRYDLSEDLYHGSQKYVTEFLLKGKYDVIISVCHTINPVLIRLIKELEIATKYYIVITDPFNPIAGGYSVVGANRYYCANEMVEKILLKNNISPKDILVSGYPINPKFNATNKRKENKNRKTILLNSGSQGNINYFNILKYIVDNYSDSRLKIIMICGKNSILAKRCQKLVDKYCGELKIVIYGFVENLYDILGTVDVMLSKPGANSFFEALYCHIPLIIDSMEGLIYQEKGVRDFINDYKIGYMIDNYNDLDKLIARLLYSNDFESIEYNISKYDFKNGTSDIVDDMLKHSL